MPPPCFGEHNDYVFGSVLGLPSTRNRNTSERADYQQGADFSGVIALRERDGCENFCWGFSASVGPVKIAVETDKGQS